MSFVLQFAAAMPDDDEYPPFTVRAFSWRGREVRSLEDVYQSVRRIAEPETAERFRALFAAADPDAEMLLGYVITEFDDAAERRQYVALFNVEHPIMGTLEEMEGHSPEFKMLLGFLFGAGLGRDDLRLARELARGISPAAAAHALGVFWRLDSLPPARVFDVLRTVMSGCDGDLRH